MIAVEEKKEVKKARKLKAEKEIPSYLIYEWLDGVPVYYKGYRDVLNKTKKFEEIMAYGDLQAILLTYIRKYLESALSNKYFLIQGETGVHIEHKTNPSLDLCIFLSKQISIKKAANKYFEIAPLVVIEVDTKADMTAFEEQAQGNYFMIKTQKLLDFGVETMVWVFTNIEKVTIARPNQPWLIVDWKDEIEILGHRFSINQVIESS